ncbi:MAG: hypothetical protein ACI88G_000734 [Woeseiaceae bacterium]|jgi:hypothetical protein
MIGNRATSVVILVITANVYRTGFQTCACDKHEQLARRLRCFHIVQQYSPIMEHYIEYEFEVSSYWREKIVAAIANDWNFLADVRDYLAMASSSLKMFRTYSGKPMISG